MTATRPQGAQALDSFCAVCNRTFQPGEDRFVVMNHGKPAYARHGTLTYSPCEAAWAEKFEAVAGHRTEQPARALAPRDLTRADISALLDTLRSGIYGASLQGDCSAVCEAYLAHTPAPLAERRGQEVEKRIRAACDDYFRTGSTEALDDVLRRHFADLGASQQFSSTNIEGGRRFKQVLPNEDVGAQQQCTDRVEVPRRWVIAVNEFIEDWQKGDFNLPQLAALDAQAIIEAGADGPDLEACLNCGTDHSKGECRVVVAPASQDNPAPRCWCGRVLDDSAHLDNSLIHCEGEHGENKAHWFQPERRTGPAERRKHDHYFDQGDRRDSCKCGASAYAQAQMRRTGPRDRRQPQAASFLEDLMEQKSDFDTSLDRDTQIERSALPGKEGSQMDDIISLRNEINERSVDIAGTEGSPMNLPYDKRDPGGLLRRAGVDLDQKQAADDHFKAKPAGTISTPAAQNTTGYAATVPEVPTCHKCGAFMVKAKPVYDCPECGATTAITECTASPLVMAAQAQQFRFRYAEKQPADSQQIWRRAMTKPQGARRKSVPYRPGFLARLRDSKEALAYVTAALEDSEGMFITAINDVAEANQTRAADKQFRDCVPSEFTDKSGTVWTRRPR